MLAALSPYLRAHERPDLVDVHNGVEELIPRLVEVPHADLHGRLSTVESLRRKIMIEPLRAGSNHPTTRAPMRPHLAEVSRVVFVHQDAVVVLTTRVTPTAWVLPVLANASMSRGHVTALLAVLRQPCERPIQINCWSRLKCSEVLFRQLNIPAGTGAACPIGFDCVPMPSYTP